MPTGQRYQGPPLFKVCPRKSCDIRFPVSNLTEYRKRVYCSMACANASKRPPAGAVAALGRARAGAQKRRRCLEGLAGLTRLEAFQRGYMNGLRSKLTQVARRYVLVPRDHPLLQRKGNRELLELTAPTTRVVSPADRR